MARISGVDIPKQKRGVIALTYIFGIGRSRAKNILEMAKVSVDKKVSDWKKTISLWEWSSWNKLARNTLAQKSLRNQVW